MELDEFERDALKEMCNMGVSHAANSLSALTNRKISISVPAVEMLPVRRISNYAGGDAVIGISLGLSGSIALTVLLLFSRKNAFSLVDMMMQRGEGETKALEEMDKSALLEAGNILGSHFANTLADFLNLRLAPSTPLLLEGSAEAMLGSIASGRSAERSIAVNTELIESSKMVQGCFFLLSDSESLGKLLGALKQKVGM